MNSDNSLFKSVKKSTLHQQAESIDDKNIEKFFVKDKSVDLAKLIDENACLLEGNRGVGKSHILKFIEKISDNVFKEEKILTVYISFSEALKIDRITGSYGTYDPFIQWASMKTLHAIFEKAKKLELCQEPGHLNLVCNKIFGKLKDEKKIYVLLEELVNNLEMTPIQQIEKLYKMTIKIITDKIGLPSFEIGEKKTNEILQNLEHIPIIKDAIKLLIKTANIERIIILFDEAAHTLLPEQQGKFFTFFKGLKDNKISVKAAVYPLITNYGDQFDYVHDAKVVRINRSELDYEDYINFFDTILKKRIGINNNKYKMLSEKPKLYHLVMFAAFGNPRLFFDLIDEINYDKPLKKTDILKVIKIFVDTKIWEYFRDAARTKRFESYMKFGESLTKEILIPKVIRGNKDNIYFLLKDKDYSSGKQMKIIFDYLVYGGIIAYREKRSVGHGEYGRAYALNIAIALSENLISSDADIRNLKIYGARILSLDTDFFTILKGFKDIYLRHKSETSVSILRPDEQQYINQTEENDKDELKNLFDNLLNKPKTVLKGFLTTFEYNLLEDSDYHTIKDLYHATERELQSLHNVGKIRSWKFKNAVNEYLTG